MVLIKYTILHILQTADAIKVKYAAMTSCELQQVGKEFSRKPLALAVQEGSPLKENLNAAILKLLNQRKLESLKEKWWNNNPERKLNCEDSKKTSDGISIKNIGGVFVVIFIGMALACFTLIFEFLFLKKGKKEKADVFNSYYQSTNFQRTHFGNKIIPTIYNYQ